MVCQMQYCLKWYKSSGSDHASFPTIALTIRAGQNPEVEYRVEYIEVEIMPRFIVTSGRGNPR